MGGVAAAGCGGPGGPVAKPSGKRQPDDPQRGRSEDGEGGGDQSGKNGAGKDGHRPQNRDGGTGDAGGKDGAPPEGGDAKDGKDGGEGKPQKPPMSRGRKIIYGLIALMVLATLVTIGVLYLGELPPL